MTTPEYLEAPKITLLLTQQEFCWLYRLTLAELKSGEPGPAYRDGLQALARRMTNSGSECECTAELWFDTFGEYPPPAA